MRELNNYSDSRLSPLTILSRPDTDLATAIAATAAQPFGIKHWRSP